MARCYSRKKVTLPAFSFNVPPSEPVADHKFGKTYEDGKTDIFFANGRRMRTKLIRCLECEVICEERAFNEKKQLCYDCTGAAESLFRKEDRERAMAQRRVRLIAEYGEDADAPRRRIIRLSQASVGWRDKEKIRAIYAECRQLNAERGERYFVVDHIFPLQGSVCCGLHVHENLRIISNEENSRKSNMMPTLDVLENINYAIQ